MGAMIFNGKTWEQMSGFVKLWENSSPTAAFTAKTISLDLSEYEFIAITYFVTEAGANEKTTIVRKGQSAVMDSFIYVTAGNYLSLCYRSADVGGNGVTFAAGYRKSVNTSATGAVNNGSCVPTAIYGIK